MAEKGLQGYRLFQWGIGATRETHNIHDDIGMEKIHQGLIPEEDSTASL